MNTVIKGTKTIAEYKRVREDMENLARANYARHKEAFEEWGEGEPVKAWFDFEGNFSYCAAFHFVKGKASGRSRP